MVTNNSTETEMEEWLKELHRKTDSFNLALGGFVAFFSTVETNLQTYLWQFAGVPAPMAKAIFSGVRVEGAMQLINRIADAQKWDQTRKAELAYIFSQLGPINRLRNDVLHYGADLEGFVGEDWIITNKKFAHMPERVQETRINPKILEQATYDLARITLRLVILATNDPERKLEGALSDFLKIAWQYKPPVPDRASRKNRRQPRKRPLQPQSFPK